MNLKIICAESILSIINGEDPQLVMERVQSFIDASDTDEMSKVLTTQEDPILSLLDLIRHINICNGHDISEFEYITIEFLYAIYTGKYSTNPYDDFRYDMHRLTQDEKRTYSKTILKVYELYTVNGWTAYAMKFGIGTDPKVFMSGMIPLLVVIIGGSRVSQVHTYSIRRKYSDSEITRYYKYPLDNIELVDPDSKENSFEKLHALLSTTDDHEYNLAGGNRVGKFLIDLLRKKYVIVPSDFNTVNDLVVKSVSNGRDLMYELLENLVSIISEQTCYQENYILDMCRPTDTPPVEEDTREYTIDDDCSLSSIIEHLYTDNPSIEFIRDILDAIDTSDMSESLLDQAIDIAAENEYDDILALLCEYHTA